RDPLDRRKPTTVASHAGDRGCRSRRVGGEPPWRGRRMVRQARCDPVPPLWVVGRPGFRKGRRRDRRGAVRRVRGSPARAGEPEGLWIDALPARQDDPVPQRELASPDVAHETVLLLRHPLGDGWDNATARLSYRVSGA